MLIVRAFRQCAGAGAQGRSSAFSRCIARSFTVVEAGDGERNDKPASPRVQEESRKLTYKDIFRAAHTIRGGVERTALYRSYFLSELLDCNIFLKKDQMQFTGSFKERGARNALAVHKKENPGMGCIAASAGNHALALAWHGKSLDVPVTVIMPTVAPLAKVENCRRFGATVHIEGENIGESKCVAERMMAEQNLKYINGYDDFEILAGAGTMGIEIMEDMPQMDAIVVPIGGAGLIAGVATAIKTLNPEVEVIGVEPSLAPSFAAALDADESVQCDIQPTLADGLAVPKVGPFAFRTARDVVDTCVTVEEKSIALAVLRLVENEKLVVEGGGAAGLAALLEHKDLVKRLQGKNVVVPLCGGNIDTAVLGRVLDRGLAADNRLVRFIATVSDRPGGIARLTALLAENGVSVKDIYHERAWLHTSVDKVQIKCVVELRNAEHAEFTRKLLIEKGYPLIWGIDSNEGDTQGSLFI